MLTSQDSVVGVVGGYFNMKILHIAPLKCEWYICQSIKHVTTELNTEEKKKSILRMDFEGYKNFGKITDLVRNDNYQTWQL